MIPAPAPVRVDEEGVEALGRLLARTLTPPAFVALRGPLGAGKSVLTRALARGLGVRGPIPSPTYPLLLRHPAEGGVELVHLDLYRLDDPQEIWELGWEELGAEGEIVVVEWAGRAGPHLPARHLDVTLALVPGHPDLREVVLRGGTGDAEAAALTARLAARAGAAR